jgi:parvulin-like peptidyl-prolyl isomerase
MMPKTPRISQNDILQQVKLSRQMPKILNAIVERRIVAKTAQEMGLQVEAVELQKAADSFRFNHDLLGAKETVAWLQRYVLSLDDLEALVYHTVLSAKLSEQLFGSKVESHFAERQLDYTQVVLFEVVLNNPDLAMELFYAIQENEVTFAEVARQYHQDPELRRKGGYRGLVKRQDLKPELSVAIFAATPPQILKPIAMGKKVHLIWVEDIIQPSLDDPLRSQIQTELFSYWLQQQIAQVNIAEMLDPAIASTVDR